MGNSRRTPARVRPAPPVKPPHVTRTARVLIRAVGRLYLRAAQRVGRVTIHDGDQLFEALEEFYTGNCRLIIAFRHVDKADGPVMMHLVANLTTRLARQNGIKLKAAHTYFLHGRDVLVWGGPPARFAFPRLGGIPVVNAHSDSQSLRSIRSVLREARHPLSLAPETQVTYRMFEPGPVSAGVGVFARWAAAESDSRSRVLILPVAIGYDYPQGHSQVQKSTIQRLSQEAWTGGILTLPHVLDLTERLLEKVRSQLLPEHDRDKSGLTATVSKHPKNAEQTAASIRTVCDAALRRGESIMGLGHQGPSLERLFRLRHACHRAQFLDSSALGSLSQNVRSFADFRAVLGRAADRYQQLADILLYLDPRPLSEHPSDARFTEYALNLLDVKNRLEGGTIETRYAPKNRRAIVIPGPSLDAGGILAGSTATAREGVRRVQNAVAEAFSSGCRQLELKLSKMKSPTSHD